ncbi:hypothetical protein WME91_34950 [Sorangium sp. So ce269]
MLLFSAPLLVLACHKPPRAAPPPLGYDPGAPCMAEGQGSTQYEDSFTQNEGKPVPPCCPGLKQLDLFQWNYSKDEGECLPNKGGAYACLSCGDGECRLHENECNCPEDC